MTTDSQKIEFDGAKLADLREECGYSQAEVARRVGIRLQSLCRHREKQTQSISSNPDEVVFIVQRQAAGLCEKLETQSIF